MTAEIIWFAREICEENREHAMRNATYSAQVLEDDREEGRRLWAEYLAAIRKSVDAQQEVTKAHNAWMDYEGRARG